MTDFKIGTSCRGVVVGEPETYMQFIVDTSPYIKED